MRERGPPCSRICRIRVATTPSNTVSSYHLTRHFPPIYSSPPRNQARISQGRIHPIFPDVLFFSLFIPLLPSFLYFRFGSLSNERAYLTFIFGTRDHFWSPLVGTRLDEFMGRMALGFCLLVFFFSCTSFPPPSSFLYTFNRNVIRIDIYSRVVSIDSKSFRGIRMIRAYIRWMVRVFFIVALLLDAKL